jgi:hypothetical protein
MEAWAVLAVPAAREERAAQEEFQQRMAGAEGQQEGSQGRRAVLANSLREEPSAVSEQMECPARKAASERWVRQGPQTAV